MQNPSYEVGPSSRALLFKPRRKKCACQAGDIVRCDPVTDSRPKSSFFSGKNNKKGSKWTITGSLTEFVRIRFNYVFLSTCTVQMNQGRADAVTKRIPVVTQNYFAKWFFPKITPHCKHNDRFFFSLRFYVAARTSNMPSTHAFANHGANHLRGLPPQAENIANSRLFD